MPIGALTLAFASASASAFAFTFALVSALALWAAMLLPAAIGRPFLVNSRASRVIFVCFAHEINVTVPRYSKRKLCNSTGIRYGEVAKTDNVHSHKNIGVTTKIPLADSHIVNCYVIRQVNIYKESLDI